MDTAATDTGTTGPSQPGAGAATTGTAGGAAAVGMAGTIASTTASTAGTNQRSSVREDFKRVGPPAQGDPVANRPGVDHLLCQTADIFTIASHMSLTWLARTIGRCRNAAHLAGKTGATVLTVVLCAACVRAGFGPTDAARDSSVPADAGVPFTRWTAKNGAPYASLNLASAVLSDGLHILGGIDAWKIGTRYTRHYVYQPATNSWSSTPANTPDSHTDGPQAQVFQDRMYLVGGGTSLGRALRVYDPSTNKWDTTLPQIPGPAAFEYGFASAIVGDSLYVIGGHPAPARDAPVYRFDLVQEVWSRRAAIPENAGGGSLSGAAVGNKIYVLGSDPQGAGMIMQIYDANENSWTRGTGIADRLERATAVARGTEIYFLGGATDHDRFPADVKNAANIYDTANDTWRVGIGVPTARAYATGQLYNGKVHLIGGMGNAGDGLAVHEVLE